MGLPLLILWCGLPVLAVWQIFAARGRRVGCGTVLRDLLPAAVALQVLILPLALQGILYLVQREAVACRGQHDAPLLFTQA